MLVSTKHQHESAIGFPMSPPTWTSLPQPSSSHPSRLIELPESYTKFPLAIYFTYGDVCFHITLSIPPTLCFLPATSCVYKSVINVCVSIAALQIGLSVPDAGRDWGQEEKGMTEDEMAGWHHGLDGHESEWTPGDSDEQGGLACYDSWVCKESDTTEQLNWTEP